MPSSGLWEGWGGLGGSAVPAEEGVREDWVRGVILVISK